MTLQKQSVTAYLGDWLLRAGKLTAPVAIVALMSVSFAQVDFESSAEGLDQDYAPFPLPELREVTRVDLAAGMIFLDGEAFSIADLLEQDQALDLTDSKQNVDFQSLRRGERVIVKTDGTAPSPSNVPRVLSVRRP